MLRTTILATLALALLTGCATLSETECRAGNWYDIGRADGADGRKEDFLLQHAKACNEHGVKPIASEWRQGRAEGLKLYCTPKRAHHEGTRGKHLSPVCPAEDLARLERANARGLRYHLINQEISSLERDISHINAEIAALPPGDPARSALISERSLIRLDILHLRTDRNRFRSY